MKSNTEANNSNANDFLFPYNLIASWFDFKHETTTAKTTNKSKL